MREHQMLATYYLDIVDTIGVMLYTRKHAYAEIEMDNLGTSTMLIQPFTW